MKTVIFLILTLASILTHARLDEVIDLAGSKKKPVVILDLDDTLFYSSSRTKIIFNELSQNTYFISKYPSETEILSQIRFEEVQYSIKDTIKAMGISNNSFIDEAEQFWIQRFFTNEYVKDDTPVEGAIKYVNLLFNSGIKIVYLTGRDESMRSGTIESLEKYGFPLNGESALLITKKEFNTPDIEYKKRAFAKIKKMGTVIGFFENEPKNINAMIDFFSSEAIPIFLDIKHSPTNISVNPKAFWVKNYLNI